MNEKPLLSYPLAHQSITPEMGDVLVEEIRGRTVNQAQTEATLHTVFTHLLFLVFQEMARGAHGEKAAEDSAFVVGLGCKCYDQALDALNELEDTLPPCGIFFYDACRAFGFRAVDEGRIEDGLLRF